MYGRLTLLAIVIVYIVDLSGFTQVWRGLLASLLDINEAKMKSIKPFDCSQCMTWWSCIIYSLIMGEFTLLTLAYIAILALFSFPIGQFMLFLYELVTKVINTLMSKL